MVGRLLSSPSTAAKIEESGEPSKHLGEGGIPLRRRVPPLTLWLLKTQ